MKIYLQEAFLKMRELRRKTETSYETDEEVELND
jgi:hypothetical protein